MTKINKQERWKAMKMFEEILDKEGIKGKEKEEKIIEFAERLYSDLD